MRMLLTLLLALALAVPAVAAEDSADKTDKDAKTETITEDKDKAQTEKPKEEEAEKKAPSEYTSAYYKVTMPEGWIAVIPPTDQQGTTKAIFSKNPGNTTVALIIGPNDGISAKSIAQVFAEQFKAPKPPVEKNGMYSFYYPYKDATAHALVGTEGSEFIIMTFVGNEKEGLQFIKNNIKSDTHPNLLPK